MLLLSLHTGSSDILALLMHVDDTIGTFAGGKYFVEKLQVNDVAAAVIL